MAAKVVGLYAALAVGGEVRDAAVTLAGKPLGHERLAERADGSGGLGGDPRGHGGRLRGVGQDDGREGDGAGSGSGHDITPAAERSVRGECPATCGDTSRCADGRWGSHELTLEKQQSALLSEF